MNKDPVNNIDPTGNMKLPIPAFLDPRGGKVLGSIIGGGLGTIIGGPWGGFLEVLPVV